MKTFLMPQLKMLSNSSALFLANLSSSLLFVVLLLELSSAQPFTQQKSVQEILLNPSPALIPAAAPTEKQQQDHSFAAPQPQPSQQWMSVRPYLQKYRADPTSDEDFGLLLHYYLDSKRSASEDGSERHSVSGSPLGTMRFGKRTFNSPLGTMRFGKRDYNQSPFGTMRFG